MLTCRFNTVREAQLGYHSAASRSLLREEAARAGKGSPETARSDTIRLVRARL